MRKLILHCELSPGDIVMLTAAVRDLHRHYPGKFLTDVRTLCPELWEHNPYLTPLRDSDSAAERIDCEYPLIDHCNHRPYHCLHGFTDFLSKKLQVDLQPTDFKGDLHISDQEKSWMSQVHELTGRDIPFWILVAGGKYDFTIKWWEASRYQQVVNQFAGRIQFVQVGHQGHYHPSLNGVIDLRGRTNLRQLVRLVYHSQGVLCPVTSVMHLAAAIEYKHDPAKPRPCVVVAGAREPAHWEAYPHHQFIHTNGALACSGTGGCWKARTLPLHDGDERDQNLCSDVVGELPRCMDMITANEVIRRIELYLTGGALQPLARAHARAAQKAVLATTSEDQEALSEETARTASEQFIRTIPSYPERYRGRGVVICGGGRKYFPAAWVCIHMLRTVGCSLPIQLWHLGRREMDSRMKDLVRPLQVECVDALAVRKTKPARILRGWELKPYSMLHCPFKEVLLLDADNMPMVDPEFLFQTKEFRQTGAIFWPDHGSLAKTRSIWQLCGVSYAEEPEFESGQIVVDKERCWKALCLAMWYNEHSDFFYHHVHGDKETFHMAFRKTATAYAMPKRRIHLLNGVMCQHDFAGRRIFQHRNEHKWSLRRNKRVLGFRDEEECFRLLANLRQRWKPSMAVQ